MQLDFFAAALTQAPVRPAPVRAAAVPGGLRTLANALPRTIRLGTSSWAFAGWRGLIYAEDAAERSLARDGLRAYAANPLLRSVGIDRTFYGPLSATAFAAYAEQVPDDFRFIVKAPLACVTPWLRVPGAVPRQNPGFLDAETAVRSFVQPCIEGLDSKAGVLLFQVPPLPASLLGNARRAALLERLHRFLGSLPAGPLYALEPRDPVLLDEQYARVLAETGVRHCIGLHPRMPGAVEQARILDALGAGPLVARWNLRKGLSYEDAKARYRPFDRLVEEDPDSRCALARLCVDAHARGQPAYVVVNNKAEGSAPRSVFALAEAVRRELRR